MASIETVPYLRLEPDHACSTLLNARLARSGSGKAGDAKIAAPADLETRRRAVQGVPLRHDAPAEQRPSSRRVRRLRAERSDREGDTDDGGRRQDSRVRPHAHLSLRWGGVQWGKVQSDAQFDPPTDAEGFRTAYSSHPHFPDFRVTATSAPAHTPDAHLADPDRNASFTKGVFLGEIREELVFPFPALSADERESLGLILGSFRAFAADTIDSHQLDVDGRFSDAVRHGMHELGLMGMNIPESHGGFGASAKVFNRVFGEIGATDPALAVYFGAHQSIGSKGITLFGTDDQKQRWLPGCASGSIVAAFCLTEPGSGSDAQAMTTTATPSADGTTYTITGTKIWISNAGYAGLFTVFAKVPVTVDGVTKQRVTAFAVRSEKHTSELQSR